MDRRGFRVVLDFSDFFSDERKRSYIYIENVPKTTVYDLQRRIKTLFNIKGYISLLTDGCFLHPQETVYVLREEDVVKVVHCGSSGKNTVEEEEEESSQEDRTLKRKRERGKELEKGDEGNPRPRKHKIKKLERNEALKDIDGGETSTDKATRFNMQATEEENSQEKANHIDLNEKYDSEIAANDSILGYKKKIKRKKNKKACQKETSDSENVKDESYLEEWSTDKNVSSFSQVSNQCVDSGVAVSGEGEAETQTLENKFVHSPQSVKPIEGSLDESIDIKKKRRRRHKKKKKDATAINGHSSPKTNGPPHKYEVPRLGAGKHIKFEDDCEEEKAEEIDEGKNNDSIPYLEKSIAIKNSEPSKEVVVSKSDIAADIMNRINAFIQTRKESNGEMFLNTPTKQECPDPANNYKSPPSQWDVQSSSRASGNSQLFSGIFNPQNISTPLVFECKRPVALTAQVDPKTSSQSVKDGIQNYLEYPLLQSSPKENDVLAFKVWKLGEDYSPGISDYIVGKVLIFSESEKYIKFKILHGHAELKEPDGKFSVNRRPEEEEDKEEVAIIEEEPAFDELETQLGDIFEVRLLFP